MNTRKMKNDLIFLKTGTYRGMAIGDSIEKLKETIKEPFHNMSDGDTEIYSDDTGTEFTFINNELRMIVLKSFKNEFLCMKFNRMIKKLNKRGINWHFNKDLIFDKQLTIQIGFSSVDLIFDLEHQDGPILRKVGLYK